MPSLHSLVIPVFNEELVLRELHRRIVDALDGPLRECGDRYEILLVDDGSTDGSRALLDQLLGEDPEHVRLVLLSRNFGHQAAITAGIDHAAGDTVTLLDADLQDPPEVIVDMLAKWREGYDVVYGIRSRRETDTAMKRLTARAFYWLLRLGTRIDIPADVGDFRLMSRKVVDAVGTMREQHRLLRGMVAWVGFRQTSVSYARPQRLAGETKFPFGKMLKLAWDGFTGFSLQPLKLATYMGLFSAAVALIIGAWALYIRLLTDRAVQGWTSLMIAVLFLGGVQLLSVGILGEYVGRIFEETKRRPLYVVESVHGRDR